jgi:hypothetical protein
MNKYKFFFKFIFVPLITSVVSGTSFCQNMVPNPSFEEHKKCPDKNDKKNWPTKYFYSRIYSRESDKQNLKYWSSERGGAGYINTCSFDTTSQYDFVKKSPKTGNGFVKLYLIEWNVARVKITRESIKCELKTKMKEGERYKVEFYIRPNFESNRSFDFINVNFSKKGKLLLRVGNAETSTKPLTLKKDDGQWIDDKSSWTKVSGIYESTGGEQYLTIGYLPLDTAISSKEFPTPKVKNYNPRYKAKKRELYYLTGVIYDIDDVSVKLMQDEN